MSDMKIDEPEELNIVVDNVEDRAKDNHFADEGQNIDVHEEKTLSFTDNSDVNVVNPISSRRDEETIKKKYGGLMAKKHPLISKNHERAFFDSADWALNKQGSQKSKCPLEALRPKLEPSPHQQLRVRSSYARLDDSEADDERNAEILSDDQSSKLDFTEVENYTLADQR